MQPTVQSAINQMCNIHFNNFKENVGSENRVVYVYVVMRAVCDADLSGECAQVDLYQ